jgi:hypothetical protein
MKSFLCLMGIFCGDKENQASTYGEHTGAIYRDSVHVSRIPTPGEYMGHDFDLVGVIPDIHGDLVGFIGSLELLYRRAGGQVSDSQAFAGMVRSFLTPSNDASFNPLPTPLRVLVVQLGDLTDRGPFTIECVLLAANIERIFPRWTFTGVWGNHEFMNHVPNDNRYVHSSDTLQGHQRTFQFSPEGQLWKHLLRSYNLMSILRGSKSFLFVHAGININWVSKNNKFISAVDEPSLLGQINVYAKFISSARDTSKCSVLEDENSPIWTRDFENLDEQELCSSILPKLQKAFGVNFIFIGHNPQRNRLVKVRCGGAIVIADSAISQYIFNSPSSNPTVIVISNKRGGEVKSVEALYTSAKQIIWTDNTEY